MTNPHAVPLAWRVLIEDAMHRCADAGFGRVEQTDGFFRFEAYPGQEDAAADFIERHVLDAPGGMA